MAKAKQPLSALEEVALRYADARKRMAQSDAKQAGGLLLSKSFGTRDDSGFSTPAQWRSLDSIKAIPKRGRSLSPGARLHASGARTEPSVSLATTSLTVRSAVQIRADRAFKQSGEQSGAKLNEKPEEVAAWLDLKPLDHGKGPAGVGTEAMRQWTSKLREIVPAASKGDPVANNALSRDGMRCSVAPGFFAQVPERLGRWREEFGKLDSTGAESGGGRIGQWVPEAVLRRRRQELRSRESKAAAEREKAQKEFLRIQAAEKARREREDAERREAEDEERIKRAAREEEERIKAEKKARRLEREKAAAAAAERLSGKR